MTPRESFRELMTHTRALIEGALLMAIAFGHMLLSIGILFCTTFNTTFTMIRNTLDRMNSRVHVEKGTAFEVLPEVRL